MLLSTMKKAVVMVGWVGLALLLAFAIYLSVLRLAFFFLEYNQSHIESYLQTEEIESLEIGSISGHLNVHDPVFVFKDIFVNLAGNSEVVIDSLTIQFSSVRSLLSRTAILKEITISGVSFTVENSGRGYWVKGLNLSETTIDVDNFLGSLSHLEFLRIDGINVNLMGPGSQAKIVSHATDPWIVFEKDEVRYISFPFLFERKRPNGKTDSRSVSLGGSYEGRFKDADFTSQFYFESEKIDLSGFSSGFEIFGRRLSSATLAAKFWVTLKTDYLDITGDVELEEALIKSGTITLFDEAKSTFRYQRESSNLGKLSIPTLRLKQDNFDFEIYDVAFAVSSGSPDSLVAGQIKSAQVSNIIQLMGFAAERKFVPNGILKSLLQMSPEGELRDINFTSGLDGGLHLACNFFDLSLDTDLKLPSVNQISGFMSFQPDRGYLDFDSDEFQIHFKHLFDSPWKFDSGRGRLAYRVSDDKVSLTSGLIELLDNGMSAYGKLVMHFPPIREQWTWGLTIGVLDLDLKKASGFVPKSAPEKFRSWLKSSIRSGQANEAGVTIHGVLSGESSAVRKAHDLYVKVENSEIQYHAEWPPAKEVSGTIRLDNYKMKSNRLSGKVYSSKIENAELTMIIPGSGEAQSISLSAGLKGPLDDALRVIKETPLSDATSRIANQWSALGDMQAKIALQIPIGSEEKKSVRTSASVKMQAAVLEMSDAGLSISDLVGELRYQDEMGLTSDKFTGTILGGGITGRIFTEKISGIGETIVQIDGSVDMEQLYRWSDQVLLSKAFGALNYRTKVHVPFGRGKNEVNAEIFSDLSGVTVDLPEPLGKPLKNSIRNLKFRRSFGELDYRIDLSLDDNLHGSLKVKNGLVTGGGIHFGKDSSDMFTYDGIRISGKLSQIDFSAWEMVAQDFSKLSNVQISDEIAPHFISADLMVEKVLLDHLSLDETMIRLTRSNDHWKASIKNEILDGEVRINDVAAPWTIDMNWVNYESGGSGIDPLFDVSPKEIGPFNFSTKRLLIDGEDFGRWSFKYRVEENVGRFEDLVAESFGVQVVAESLGEWLYESGEHVTRFSGNVVIKDLARMQEKFGYASSVEGQDLKMALDLAWDGSPVLANIERLSGNVEIFDGSGRFVQAESGGALKILGIFDFASLARRFRFDFSDVIDEGLEFKKIQGKVALEEGKVVVHEPIVVDGSGGKFTVGGSMDFVTGELDNDMIVTLPVGRSLPWYAAYSAIVTGPLTGASVMLARTFFEDQIDQISSAKYKISGSIEKPIIDFVTIFNDTVREAP